MYQYARSALSTAGALLILTLPACERAPAPEAMEMSAALRDLALDPRDMRSGGDMANAPSRDMRAPADMARTFDLAMPPPDLTPPMLGPLPACTGANVTAAMVYSQVSQIRCAIGGCHDAITQTQGLHLGPDGAGLRNKVVNVQPVQMVPSGFRLIVPKDLNRSYLIYKITGYADRVNGSSAMPPGMTLSDMEKCLLIDWVNAGAN